MAASKFVLSLLVLTVSTPISLSTKDLEHRHSELKHFPRDFDAKLREKEGPYCPPAQDILPCVCEASNATLVHLSCYNVTSEELANVFKQDFPVNELEELSIINSTAPLTLNFSTNVVSFAAIEFSNTGSLEIRSEFFASSFDRLEYLSFTQVEFTSDGFPFNSLPNFETLYELAFYTIGLSTLPAISSGSLIYIFINSNDIESIEPGKDF